VCVPLRRNGNGTGRESMRVMDRVMGTGQFFFKIASESEKVFARILDGCVRCLRFPKKNLFS